MTASSISIKDYTTGVGVDVKSTNIGGKEIPHSIIASPLDGAPLFRDGMFDAASRMRMSLPIPQLVVQSEYQINTRFWDTTLTSGGSVTHLPAESAATLSTGAGTSGNKAIIQTKRYMRYRPGLSQLDAHVFIFGAGVTDVKRRVGRFDANNGLFLEQSGTSLSFVRRSKVTGSVVDTSVAQASWFDPFDGTGPSGITLDFTKMQTMVIVTPGIIGTVMFGFYVGGILWPACYIHTANVLSTSMMTTANLPLRFEIVNAAAVAGANTMVAYSAGGFIEGAPVDPPLEQYSASNMVTAVAVTTRRPILSIRPATTLNSIAFRGIIIPKSWSGYAEGGAAQFDLVIGGVLTGASWGSVDSASSGAQRDVAATAITGGLPIGSGYEIASGFNQERPIFGDEVLCLDGDGGQTQILTLCATSIAGGSVNCFGVLDWLEDK